MWNLFCDADVLAVVRNFCACRFQDQSSQSIQHDNTKKFLLVPIVIFYFLYIRCFNNILNIEFANWQMTRLFGPTFSSLSCSWIFTRLQQVFRFSLKSIDVPRLWWKRTNLRIKTSPRKYIFRANPVTLSRVSRIETNRKGGGNLIQRHFFYRWTRWSPSSLLEEGNR